MEMKRRKIDSSDANQMNLFDAIEEINPRKFSQVDFQTEARPIGLRLKDAILRLSREAGSSGTRSPGK